MSTRVWFITGASTGLGRALTELILEKDEIAVATVRTPAVLDDLVKRHPSTRLLVLKVDVNQKAYILDAFSRAKAVFGHIDVVVNNAGIGYLGEIEATDDGKARELLQTNFWGALDVTREAIRFFRDENTPGVGGRLLQMSSYAGLVGLPGLGSYVASKFALEGMTETLAAEIDPKWNIKITLLEPGWVRSAMAPRLAWPPEHPAYAANSSLPTTVLRRRGLDNLVTWKDTMRSANVFYKAASLADPPLHLLVGKDAIEATKKKLSSVLNEVEKYEAWSEGLEE